MFVKVISIFLLAITLQGCSDSKGENAKYKVYLYKQAEPDGLVCVFYSNHQFLAELNADRFIEMVKEKYGLTFHRTSKPY